MSVFADVSKGPIAPMASSSGMIANNFDPFLKGGATNNDGHSDHFQKDQADPSSTDGASALMSHSSILLSITAFYCIKIFWNHFAKKYPVTKYSGILYQNIN